MLKKYNEGWGPIPGFDDFEEEDELYELYSGRLILYTSKIETDIDVRLNVQLNYMSMSNYNSCFIFWIQEEPTFEIYRRLKKYFLDTIPFVVKTELDNSNITIYIDKKSEITLDVNTRL